MLGKHLHFALLASTTVAALGCGAQADTSYRGEPLARFQGEVETTNGGLKSVPPPLDAALLWSGTPPGADAKATVARKEVGTSVPVNGQFPSKFSLLVYTPPPVAALFSCFHDDPAQPGKIATATISAIAHGANTSSLKITDLYGQVQDFTVAYVDADLPAVSDCPVGALAKGYHLFKVTPSLPKPGCGADHPPDDPTCHDPWPYVEVPLSTDLALVLSHDDGTATPPPADGGTATPPPPAGATPAPAPPAGGP